MNRDEVETGLGKDLQHPKMASISNMGRGRPECRNLRGLGFRGRGIEVWGLGLEVWGIGNRVWRLARV